ncbi:MmgE/PrpD family protein [Virgibacillus natechei]|uniref:MmgE/PrpD family protein n=1 Tax=Virgibacillus sp. CBA3643 TaxID=2942278 RepID=UPI0035A38B55
MKNAIEELSDFLVDTSYDDISSSLINKAKDAMIDSHAVILSGYEEEVSNILIDWVKDQEGASQSTILGYGVKSTVSLSAFMHGVMGHAIDYDDVFPPLRGHPSLLVYASIISVAEFEKISGKEMILSFLLGTEVMAKIGMNLNPSHYLKGWHSTSTIGVFGSAVAVGKLYGFNKKEFKTLLGLVSSMMSGIRKNFGTMTKPLHVGNASRSGVEAAQLVRKGFTASHTTFDSPKGIFDLYSDENRESGWEGTFGKPWSILDPGFHTKKYPCCYAIHRYIDAINDITSNNKIDVNEITKIECIGSKGSFAPLINYAPKTGLEGKFSLEYVISSALIDGPIDFNSFTDEKVIRKCIKKLMRKIKVIEDNSIEEDRSVGINGFITVNMYLIDEVIKIKIVDGKGSAKNPLTKYELKEKYINCSLKSDLGNKPKKDYKMLKKLQNINDIQEMFVK